MRQTKQGLIYIGITSLRRLRIFMIYFFMEALKYVIILWLIAIASIVQGQSFSQIETDKNTGLQEMGVIDTKPYALIAGGSKGIGYAIAEAFAKRGYNLVLIARHLDSLISAKNKLESLYGISAEVLVYDLSFDSSIDAIVNWCIQKNLPLKALCNVAGYGGEKDYLSSLPLDSLRYMVNLNVSSCMALTLRLLPLLRQNTPAYILNVASMAGFAPIPIKNMYSATKSF